MPSETFNHRATTEASPAAVWGALQLAKTWEGIPGVDDVTSPAFDPDGSLAGFEFSTRVGARSFQGKASRNERVDGRAIGWDIASPDISGAVRVGVTPISSGSEIEVTLVVSSNGMLSTMFFPAIVSAISNGFPATVEDFARALSTS